ncbi:MAG: tRNA pseudouridine(55) synthase TruB [Spirochaetes bacterium]|nr:tRNA pseudouridine(55) synthase TruB [Spirochaetota bacterium]
MTKAFSGFFSINKPPGISTYDIIRKIKKKTGIKKLGHSGTLDPFAEGVVVILVGQMTRLFDFFSFLPKTYRGFAEFGKRTDSLDITGKVVETAAPPDITAIKKNINSFIGTTTQRPPAYSAVHVNGVRAYELARKGIEPDLKEKNITIYSIGINSYEDNILDFEITCSSGTYIRVFADDLAKKCNSAAYLTKLIRKSIGGFALDITVEIDKTSLEDLISPVEGLNILNIPIFTADSSLGNRIIKGKTLSNEKENYPNKIISFFTKNNDFLALVDNRNSIMNYIFVTGDTQGMLYESN